jgi:preprotein translocase subunit SecF
MPSVDVARSSTKTPFHLVHFMMVWFALSALVIVPGFIALCTRGLNLGTDFTGGAQIAYVPANQLPAGVAERGQLAASIARAAQLGSGAVKILDLGTHQQILVTARIHDPSQIDSKALEIKGILEQNFGDQFGALEQPKADETFVGPTIGRELRRQAILMLVLGLSAILIYLWVRYNVRMAVGAVIALAHDALVLVGVMAIGHWEINSPFIAAVLTVLGFSVHDSIVIFDRIRENMQSRAARNEPYADVVNFALWQTMSRSVNTVLTVIIVLVCLLLLGGATIFEFAVALLVGMVSGAYSSIFNASQIVVLWETRTQRKKAALKGAQAGVRPVIGPAEARRRAEGLRRAEQLAAAESLAASSDDDEYDDEGGTKPRAQDAKKARQRVVRKSKRRF